MVDFKAVGDIAHAYSFITVGASNDDDFVSTVLQALSHIKDVHLYASDIGNKEIGDYGYSQPFK